jgi:prefoldin subunit 5
MELPSSKRSGLYYYIYKGGIHILQSIQNEINNLEKQLESARSEIDRLPRGKRNIQIISRQLQNGNNRPEIR